MPRALSNLREITETSFSYFFHLHNLKHIAILLVGNIQLCNIRKEANAYFVPSFRWLTIPLTSRALYHRSHCALTCVLKANELPSLSLSEVYLPLPSCLPFFFSFLLYFKNVNITGNYGFFSPVYLKQWLTLLERNAYNVNNTGPWW